MNRGVLGMYGFVNTIKIEFYILWLAYGLFSLILLGVKIMRIWELRLLSFSLIASWLIIIIKLLIKLGAI